MSSWQPPQVSPIQAPDSICLFRLSALGDCVNVVPIVHTLQRHWPQTKITWVIGKLEATLVGDLPGVEYVVLDKKAGRHGRIALGQQFADKKFDALLHMHAGFRANLGARRVPADIRMGFNKERSRDLQGWFVNQRIDPPARGHVVDGFFGFLQKLGLEQAEHDWSLPVTDDLRAQAQELLPGDQPTLLISPCSSHALRNWLPKRYAAVAYYAIQTHGMRVVLVGGPSPQERAMGDAISTAMHSATDDQVIDLIGRSPLKLLVALLERATMLVSPDAGPAHMANITRTPVIALHAATDSQRSGPYTSLQWCVDCYDEAARKFLHKPASQLKWGTKIEREGVMDLISVEAVQSRILQLAKHLKI